MKRSAGEYVCRGIVNMPRNSQTDAVATEKSRSDGPNVLLDIIQKQIDDLRINLVTTDKSSPRPLNSCEMARLVREIIRSRRKRERIFGGALFGEPVWDMLLELFSAELTERELSISSVCYASAV